jgi:hypothetical protein
LQLFLKTITEYSFSIDFLKFEVDLNLLLKIIHKIHDNKWCFNFNGACSTCGMQDVKSELKNYRLKDVIVAIETFDFENETLCRKYITDLQKIYSLVTGKYSVYLEKYSFFEFEKNLKNNFQDNQFVECLLEANYNTYWRKWKIQREAKELIEQRLSSDRELRIEKRKKLAQSDNKLRNSQYRTGLIEQLSKMRIEQRLDYLANDIKHTIKFYPSILVIEAEDKLPDFDITILKRLYQKLVDSKVGIGPWRRFKKKLREYIDLTEK